MPVDFKETESFSLVHLSHSLVSWAADGPDETPRRSINVIAVLLYYSTTCLYCRTCAYWLSIGSNMGIFSLQGWWSPDSSQTCEWKMKIRRCWSLASLSNKTAPLANCIDLEKKKAGNECWAAALLRYYATALQRYVSSPVNIRSHLMQETRQSKVEITV